MSNFILKIANNSKINQNKTKFKLKLLPLFALVLWIINWPVLALAQTVSSSLKLSSPAVSSATTQNPVYDIFLDQATIVKGYTVSSFNNNIKLSLLPNLFTQPTKVEIQQITDPMPEAWNLKRLSPIYQFDFANKSAYDNTKPFYLQLSYSTSSPFYKQVYFFDKNYNAWRPLPTYDYPLKKFVRARIHLPFARLAVFADPDILTFGRASWYKYKGGLFAASPDFPKGSRLRVFLIKNGQRDKFIDVIINDYGPDRARHPDRVLDLDKVAFARLSSLSAGVIDIFVEPLYIAPRSNSLVMAQKQAVAERPIVSADSAVVIDSATGEILFAKNATTTRPIASLTKIVAVYVFLSTRPSLNQVVVYRAQDEEYNYKYCSRWESARLHVKDRESLTIQDLIYASLVGSANNTVETLVRASGLSRTQFIARMNELVKRWGADHTHFVEPTGLSPENISTAKDYALIAAKALQHPIIAKASITAKYEFSTVNTKQKHIIYNTNHLIRFNKMSLSGSKTGYLDEAKYCLMARAGKDPKHQIIAVVLGAPTRVDSEQDIKNLIKFGLKINFF